ncbi:MULTISPECIES: protoporphyrinogen/coproporphyrinogen oxidase [Nostocales]|uniref:Protoporphyrinogen oxidase-like protein n=3 Tax=Nostocales TaxID=1161 RepID=A0A8S9T3Y2_9CYAN|nr:FAD-dependent oxidoreductase [Tolypothrix bouteillei]KAF3886312.1 protoporphyrinogen oxidase-like protein [Tolypothrix bouteillei VB521301]
MEKYNTIILGAGVTGLAAGMSSKCPVFEALEQPGGICGSYYIKPQDGQRQNHCPEDGKAYRFEYGGGHWIFGGDPSVLRFMRSLTPFKSYNRRSTVYFPDRDIYVPYPLQNHLSYLGTNIASQALIEIASNVQGHPKTLADWLYQNFGKTLTDLFFAPFHELYTAGLWTEITPQDAYKSPVSLSSVIQGAFESPTPVGYNTTYLYPTEGLNTLVQKIAESCDVRYGKKVEQIDVKTKEVIFSGGLTIRYDKMISTLPLNRMMLMTGLHVEAEPDPYTSVLVLNIGATKGCKCPNEHWIYIPHSKSGFHRVGFYSNVDVSFLPISSRANQDRVSIYVEKAYRGGTKPTEVEIRNYSQAVVEELCSWGYIQQVEVVDPTWIDVAYTWSWAGSRWKQQALQSLEEHDIYLIGRYGRWIFQGIADSIKDGLFIGASLAEY